MPVPVTHHADCLPLPNSALRSNSPATSLTTLDLMISRRSTPRRTSRSAKTPSAKSPRQMLRNGSQSPRRTRPKSSLTTSARRMSRPRSRLSAQETCRIWLCNSYHLSATTAFFIFDYDMTLAYNDELTVSRWRRMLFSPSLWAHPAACKERLHVVVSRLCLPSKPLSVSN